MTLRNEMDTQQEKNKQDIPDIKIYCHSCGACILDSTLRYKDQWGEIWYRETLHTIRRLSDNCVGNWFDGKNMTLVDIKKENI